MTWKWWDKQNILCLFQQSARYFFTVMSINLDFIILYHHSLSSFLCFKLLALSTQLLSALSCVAQSLWHSLLNHFLIKINLLFTDRQSDLSDDQVMSINVSSSCHVTVVPGNDFDKVLRNCKLIKIMNCMNLHLQESTWHFNSTAEYEMHQHNSNSVIRDTVLFCLLN